MASDDMAVAVIPIGWPSTQMVMMFTVDATRRIADRKSSLKLTFVSLTATLTK
ncbi:MAG TPA: hypothetical protein VJR87_12155 [Allosphingosinicella sp.]|nr:hypothetical protein [Allosphingosinicella sp.]